MSRLWIDAERAMQAARAWAAWGDDLAEGRLRVAEQAVTLGPGSAVGWADRCLALACAELWAASTWMRLLVDRVMAGDSAGALAMGSSPVSCAAPSPVSALGGDRGGTFDAELRSPYDVSNLRAADVGRALVVRALEDTGSLTQMRPDEFQVVELGGGRYLIVLPGVTDLSRPDPGYSDDHRSVRDLDREAFGSLASVAVSDNGYARMVWDGLRTVGVPVGSELVLVGHSFGADTALDLAADAGFNGPGGYRVSHVVAAGYDSVPQLAHVPAATRVLVLQNRDDAIVIAEKIGRAHVADAIEAHAGVVADAADLDLRSLGRSAASALAHDAAAVVAGVDHLVDRRADLAGGLVDVVTGDLDGALGHAHVIATADPGTRLHSPSQVSVVFDGGVAGAGHHQRHYVEYLETASDPAVISFLASVGGVAGPVIPGRALAVDVSVPDRTSRPPARNETQD